MRQLSVQSVWCSSQWGSHMRRSNLCRTKQISLTGHWLQVHVVTLWPSVFKVHAVHHSENEALSAFHYGALWLMSGHVYPEIMQEGAFSFKGHDPLSSSINQFPGQNSRTWERKKDKRLLRLDTDWLTSLSVQHLQGLYLGYIQKWHCQCPLSWDAGPRPWPAVDPPGSVSVVYCPECGVFSLQCL